LNDLGRGACDVGFNASVSARERGDRTKRCWKMMQRQWARLNSMGRKCDTAQQPDDIGRRRGGTGRRKRGDTSVGLTQILLSKKIKKIHTTNSAGTNWRI
jgi:hypothetical protein